VKIYGHGYRDNQDNISLRETVFEILPDEAERIGRFFLACATGMSRADWDHEHFNNGHDPEIVVCKSVKR